MKYNSVFILQFLLDICSVNDTRINTLRPSRNGSRFTDQILKNRYFLNKKLRISNKTSFRYTP